MEFRPPLFRQEVTASDQPGRQELRWLRKAPGILPPKPSSEDSDMVSVDLKLVLA